MALNQHYGGQHNGGSVLIWLRRVRMSRLVIAVCVILIVVPLVTHYWLSNFVLDGNRAGRKGRSKLDHSSEYFEVKTGDLKFRIDELNRIRLSVTTELRDLERKRLRLQSEINGYNSEIAKLKNDHAMHYQGLDKLKLAVEQVRLEKNEIAGRNTPELRAPLQVLPPLTANEDVESPKMPGLCEMSTCFDFSRCSLLSGFPVYVYDPSKYRFSDRDLDSFILSAVETYLGKNAYATNNSNSACVYIVFVGEINPMSVDVSNLESNLRNLPTWRGDGRNHILVNLARTEKCSNIFDGINTGRAIIAQSSFRKQYYRSKFDIILPPSVGKSHGDVWDELPPLVPAKRQYLLTFRGLSSFKSQHNTININNLDNKSKIEMIQSSDTLDSSILKELEKMRTSATMDKFYFETNCYANLMNGEEGEWAMCGSPSSRTDSLQQSTFALVISPEDRDILSTPLLQLRLIEYLKNGAIPLILGDNFQLPFEEILPWKRAVLRLSKARVTEIHFYLRTFSDADILELRRNGRFLYETYFGTMSSILDSMLALLRFRLQMSPLAMTEEPTPSIFNQSYVPLKVENFPQEPDTVDEVLGPVEPPYASPRFTRNFSLAHDKFLVYGDPFHMFPNTPYMPVVPSEAKFVGSSYGFRPVGHGAGGAGKEFSEALGGNSPREQFTVVILTYERDAVLITAIQRLRGLPYLNKVIVVWNSPKPPSPDIRWPEIGVKVVVVRTKANSLNNRFLPYDAIETEAILSIDDDVHLRHDEIVFGFRVWRESRDRLVGFPGRFHAWDLQHESWLYNSNYSCELSMVLTGAAFFHKYYGFLYSYVMPQAIRDKVDEYTNCEDIAMNFLISHITRKPPIKVTSRWTFHCPGCQQSLFTDDSHFQERHRCMNFFARVYGYMPLLNTQFRVDSVLFKTRIPHDKQKCFRYV